MSAISGSDDQYALEDSASIAVIGGGPTGSFFSIFTLKPAAVRAAIAEIGLGKSIISEHLCVPLKYKERIFGVLNMSNSSEKLFALDDLKLLHTLSITASMAVQNAMNYSHLKYATDEVIKHATMLGMW